MYFSPSASISEIPRLYRDLVAITGWRPWQSRIAALVQNIRDNPLIEDYVSDRYTLEWEMSKLHRRIQAGRPLTQPRTYEEYCLYSFMAMIAKSHRMLTPTGQNNLSGMLRSALDNESGLATLQHEMIIAAALLSKDFDITFSDIESGGGFDFLAKKSGIELEVECKTHSADIGRKVHRRQLYQFGGEILPLLNSALTLRSGGQFARVILPGRLDGKTQKLQVLSACLKTVFEQGISFSGPDPCRIEYRSFNLAGSPFEASDPQDVEKTALRRFITDSLGHPAHNILAKVDPGNAAVVVSIESIQPDNVTESIENQLKKLVKRQLTGSRPGLICVRFVDITEDQLLEIAQYDKDEGASSLRRMTSNLFDREDWRQVHTVSYFAPGHATYFSSQSGETTTTHTRESGSAYVFVNEDHELAADSRLRIFTA